MEKERGMMLRAMDALIQRMNPADYPTAGRTYLATMQGDRTPITETHFSPDELAAMQRLITRKGGVSGAINYRDYDAVNQDRAYLDGTESLNTPLGNVRSTLGQFRYQYDPTAGRYTIQDSYDFNPDPDTMTAEQHGRSFLSDPKYYVARWYGGETVPNGQGRDVRIGLPPAKMRETARETMKRIVAEEANARAQQRRK